ncbi:MAG: hypothetical protein ACE5GC_02130 [Acidimicrobiia bacterium]
MSDQSQEFDAALEQFRFGDAEALVRGMEGEARSAAGERLSAAIAAATDAADDLANRIQALARHDHYAALLDLAARDNTARLLELVPAEIRRGAQLHLDGAVRRRDMSVKLARRHLDGADAALDGFDPAAAEKALAKVDLAWLSAEDRARYEELRERTNKVTEETSEIAAATAEVLAEYQPPQSARRGCLSSGLLLVAVVGALLVTAAAAVL